MHLKGIDLNMKKALVSLLAFILLIVPLVQPLTATASAHEHDYHDYQDYQNTWIWNRWHWNPEDATWWLLWNNIWWTWDGTSWWSWEEWYYEPIDLQAAFDEERELTEEEFHYFIDILGQYIEYEDGEIVIEGNFESLYYILDEDIFEDVVEYMTEGIEYLNELIDEGELIITENGTIYEYYDDEFNLQSVRRNRVTRHWWGLRVYTCQANTRRVVGNLRRNSENVLWISGFTAIFGGPVGTKFGLLGAAAAGFATRVARAMEDRNRGHSRGIITSFPWIPLGFSTSRQ